MSVIFSLPIQQASTASTGLSSATFCSRGTLRPSASIAASHRSRSWNAVALAVALPASDPSLVQMIWLLWLRLAMSSRCPVYVAVVVGVDLEVARATEIDDRHLRCFARV